MSTPQEVEAGVQARCQAWLDEAQLLRLYERPEAGASPGVVHAALLEVRGRLDRLEYLLLEVTGYRGGLRTTARERGEEADDAYDRALSALGRRAVHRDYEGAQERYAQARLQAIEERRRARLAQRVLDSVDNVESQVRTMHRGLRDVREELATTLRYLQWEFSLERT